MNRQIKFRAWDKKNSQFLQNNNIGVDETIFDLWSWADVMSTCLLFPMDDYVFQQYTELKDKNGKEICEGDIVKWGDLNYIVEYNHTACKWQGRSPEHHGYLHPVTEHFRDLMNGIIISNIFEHKHLLEK